MFKNLVKNFSCGAHFYIPTKNGAGVCLYHPKNVPAETLLSLLKKYRAATVFRAVSLLTQYHRVSSYEGTHKNGPNFLQENPISMKLVLKGSP
jgi:hypothetical protein